SGSLQEIVMHPCHAVKPSLHCARSAFSFFLRIPLAKSRQRSAAIGPKKKRKMSLFISYRFTRCYYDECFPYTRSSNAIVTEAQVGISSQEECGGQRDCMHF